MPRDSPQVLTPADFESVVQSMVDDALDHISNSIRGRREDAWKRYYGKVDAQVTDGGSNDVVTVVQDSASTIVPDLLEIYTAADVMAEFLPSTTDPIERQVCAAANLAVTSAFWTKNGWMATHDAVMEAVISGYGFYKVFINEEIKVRTSTQEMEVEDALAAQANGVNISPMWDTEDDSEEADDQENFGKYSITEEYLDQQLVIEAVPASNMFWLYSHSFEDSWCIGQVTEVMLGNLVALGFSPEELADVSSNLPDNYNIRSEENLRENNNANSTTKERFSPRMWAGVKVAYYEVYVKVDQDGDGLPELYKVWLAGGSKKVLRVKPVDDQPFILVPAYRIPHSTYSLSLADKAKEFQEAETRVLRAQIDLIEMLSGPMMIGATNAGLDEDKLTNWKKWKVFFARNPEAIKWLYPPQTSPEAFQMGEELKNRREERIGLSRMYTSLKPEDMADITATVAAASMSGSQRKIAYLARLQAELGIKLLMQKILKCVIKMGTLTVQINGQMIQMNTQQWNPSWDLRVKVGLGTGTRLEKSSTMMALWTSLSQVATQLGQDNPITDTSRLANLARDFAALQPGLNPDRYVKPEAESQAAMQKALSAPPPPDPAMEKVKMEAQAKQAETQMKGQQKQQEMQLDHQASMQRLQAEMQQGYMEMMEKMQLGWAELEQKLTIAMAEMRMEKQLEEEKMKLDHEADMVAARNQPKAIGNGQIRKPN